MSSLTRRGTVSRSEDGQARFSLLQVTSLEDQKCAQCRGCRGVQSLSLEFETSAPTYEGVARPAELSVSRASLTRAVLLLVGVPLLVLMGSAAATVALGLSDHLAAVLPLALTALVCLTIGIRVRPMTDLVHLSVTPVPRERWPANEVAGGIVVSKHPETVFD